MVPLLRIRKLHQRGGHKVGNWSVFAWVFPPPTEENSVFEFLLVLWDKSRAQLAPTEEMKEVWLTHSSQNPVGWVERDLTEDLIAAMIFKHTKHLNTPEYKWNPTPFHTSNVWGVGFRYLYLHITGHWNEAAAVGKLKCLDFYRSTQPTIYDYTECQKLYTPKPKERND